MSEAKKVRIIRSTVAERFQHDWITAYRVELLAPGIGYFTVAGFPSLPEAEAYRRVLLKEHS